MGLQWMKGGDALRVVVTGASGYVGRAVQAALLRHGHQVRAVSRSGRAEAGADGVSRDVARDALDDVLEQQDAVIHLVGIIREDVSRGITFERIHVEASQRVAESAKTHGIAHFVHMSALGARVDGQSRYFRTKALAERGVRTLVPSATVIKPSLVFGEGADFFQTLQGLAKNPVVPVPGDGSSLFDPVYRGDLAEALVLALADPTAAGETFEIGGPKRFSLNTLLDHVAAAAGRGVPVAKVHIPVALIRPMVAALESFRGFPLTLDQLAMLNLPNSTDDERWHRWVPDPTPLGQNL